MLLTIASVHSVAHHPKLQQSIINNSHASQLSCARRYIYRTLDVCPHVLIHLIHHYLYLSVSSIYIDPPVSVSRTSQRHRWVHCVIFSLCLCLPTLPFPFVLHSCAPWSVVSNHALRNLSPLFFFVCLYQSAPLCLPEMYPPPTVLY